ncbi:MAG TPA: hypothetical protein DC017_13860 [Candidatus Wallbacteria bacterium]|nr:hypothetical protein [Candidatus Wallbacteria bacterium]
MKCAVSLCLFLYSVCCMASGVAHAAGKDGGGYKLYKGAWFDIMYPAGFTVRPSIKSSTSAEGYDSVFFVSPDGKVEFYISSPQWRGSNGDIAIDEKTEKKVDEEVQKNKGRKVTYFTIAAKNGSYTRTYQHTTENDGTAEWVIGIKYAGQKDYDRYKSDYLKFKGSLKQYADGL